MAWTTPRTWVTGELVTASMMNTHIRDNLNVLRNHASASYTCDEPADYQTTSTTFVDVDSTNLSLTITTTGNPVLVHFDGTVWSYGTGYYAYFDVDIDGSRLGGDDGLVQQSGNTVIPVSFTRLVTGLSAGSHTFKLQWKSDGNATYHPTLYAGAGTTKHDVHPQFWVWET